MSSKSIGLELKLHNYLLSVAVKESEPQRALREQTANLSAGNMQISPEQGQFMSLLIQLIKAKRVLEIGCFTGYSALSMAQALPEDGELITCDRDARWLEMAERYWKEAKVAHKIHFCLGPALNTLDNLIAEKQVGAFDFAFIDADKGNYLEYYERCLTLVRQGGLVAIDNVLWHGMVADPENQEASTNAIRKFNERLITDDRIKLSLIPIGDGLSLALKL